MALVADAAPLIFLAKINQLELIPDLYSNEILIPDRIQAEVLGPRTRPDEERLLAKFLTRCTLIEMIGPEIFSKAMSLTDNCVLSLALEKKAELVVVDDRLLRKIAVLEGLKVIGTLGILMGAAKRQIISPKQVHRLLEELIEDHRFRIGTAVYDGVLKAIYGDCF